MGISMAEEQEGHISICWECETETDQTITVGIPSQPDRITLVSLCSTCYRQCYLPLAAGPHLARGALGPSARI
jgi:hypothetical protein